MPGSYPNNFIRFLGTAGTRFIMLSQRRSSGGIWFSCGGARGVIDPGPGSLVRICEASPALSPVDINTLILTHRHVDHSSDINALAEGMVLKSRDPRGFVLLTRDALEDGDRVLMRYLTSKISKITTHSDGSLSRPAADVTVESVRHCHHGVQCFGLIFRKPGLPSWGVISDTAPMADFAARYAECGVVIINTALRLPRSRLDHMTMADVSSLLAHLRPKRAVITHMGGELLDLGGEYISRRLSTKHTKVTAAEDGMIINLEDAEIV
jgi:phosphoribosyl 1,2-cyclic phosphodiesterase